MGENGSPLPRRAGVNAFGFGGANAHVVLEEYVPPKQQSLPGADGPQLIVLSAKNEARLEAYIQSMLAYLETSEVDLADFAYTLQVGRDEMPARLALVASSIEDLKRKFGEILKGQRPADSYRGDGREREAKSATTDGAAGETIVHGLVEIGRAA